MAFAHRLGYLKVSSGAVSGGKDAGHVGGHTAVHLDDAPVRLQSGQQVGGRHRPAENKYSGTGEEGSVRLQPGDGLLPLDGQPSGLYIGDFFVQPLGAVGET